ncbi:helix-turn-helix domain-containing protein [Photobacterium leiognathi]|uniref:helix-turn-helix domain-containing protein n=1 Tax=Photobacterium leiognathi TaxID=553611 RepID=UPI00273344DF|nr:AraC family transcriptional regulator [Photobacterium leiognathi]
MSGFLGIVKFYFTLFFKSYKIDERLIILLVKMKLFYSKNEYSHLVKENTEHLIFRGDNIYVEIKSGDYYVYVYSKNTISLNNEKINNCFLLNTISTSFIINGTNDVRLIFFPKNEIKTKSLREIIEMPYYFNETIIKFMLEVDENKKTDIFVTTAIKMINCFFLQEEENEIDKIKTFIMKNINNISISMVAHEFNMSIRKLQYKLKSYHVTYRRLVDEVKIKKLIHLLSLGEKNSKYLVKNSGYNSFSSANRAFIRLTGKSIYKYINNNFTHNTLKKYK